MITGNTAELDEAIRSKIRPYLYNGGQGKWIHCAHLACLRNRDRPLSKQFDEDYVRPGDRDKHWPWQDDEDN